MKKHTCKQCGNKTSHNGNCTRCIEKQIERKIEIRILLQSERYELIRTR